jgi:hypothetical protein
VSWKPMVETANEPGKFYGNRLAFATKDEAERNARDLMGRWMLVTDCRAEESTEPVNYHYTDDGQLVDARNKESA